MRKSINVETVFGTLTKEVLAKGWKARIGDWLSYLSNSAFGSEQWKMYETAIKADIEFAKANIELLSEEDYKWLLGYTSGLTLVSTDTEVMGKPKSSNGESSESQSTRWIVQITICKDIYYRTLKTKNRMSPSIYDAKCYVSENAAKQAIVSVVAENASDPAMYFWAIVVKEVLCTETSSRTIEIVKKSKKSMDIDSPEFKEALASAPFVCKTHDNSDTEVMDKFKKAATKFTATTKALTDAISKSVPENTVISESQKKLWVIQMSKGKQIWYKSNNPNSRVTTSIADAELHFTKNNAKYIAGYVCASNKAIYDLPWPVKVTVKEVLCTESSSRTIELVNPVVEAVEKPVTKEKAKARKPKVKEEWVLYRIKPNGETVYHSGETAIPSFVYTYKLEEAKKFPSYGAATKAKCKLIKAGFIALEVANVEDCK